MKNKIFIVLSLCVVAIAGLTYAKNGNIANGDTARHSVPKKNFRALTGAVYKTRSGILIFDENAEELKELIDLAEQGNVKVQCWLGNTYLGIRNVAQAVKWYGKAGNQKSVETMDALYRIVEKFNNQEAFECIIRNAEDFRTKYMAGQRLGS